MSLNVLREKILRYVLHPSTLARRVVTKIALYADTAEAGWVQLADAVWEVVEVLSQRMGERRGSHVRSECRRVHVRIKAINSRVWRVREEGGCEMAGGIISPKSGSPLVVPVTPVTLVGSGGWPGGGVPAYHSDPH